MEKSTQKFLSLLLCFAMLLSFPIAASAKQASYEETFTGTYTQPEDLKNVLVSGATITEWYGDRVNMGGHTYSVRQNEYGINLDGNMIEAKTDKTYTLWLAQYGVASISFTAPEAGRYSFETKDAGYGHTPDWWKVRPFYVDTDAETGKPVYSLRFIEYSDYYGEHYEYGDEETEHDDVYFVLDLEKDEKVVLAASANTEKDGVYDFEIKAWNEDNCKHYWTRTNWSYNEQECKEYWDEECKICGKTRKESSDNHKCTYNYESLGNDLYQVTESCMYCDYSYSWQQKHHYVEKATKISDCETRYEYKCEGCGDVDEYWTESNHNYEEQTTQLTACKSEVKRVCTKCGNVDESWFEYTHSWEDYSGLYSGVLREGKKCSICGEIRWNDVIYNDGGTILADGSFHHISIENYNGFSYTFTAPESKEYYFYSAGEEDTYGYVYDENGELVEENDDGSNQHNFKVRFEAEAGKTYTLKSKEYSDEAANYYVALSDEPIELRYSYYYDYYDNRKLDHIYVVTSEKGENINGALCYHEKETLTCIICGKTQVENWDVHYAGDAFVQITPQHDSVCGTYNYGCPECGVLNWEEALTCHSYQTIWTDEYTEEKTCTRCGDKLVIDHKPAPQPSSGGFAPPSPCETEGHKMPEKGEIISYPTIDSEGIMAYKCTVCGTELKREAVPKLVVGGTTATTEEKKANPITVKVNKAIPSVSNKKNQTIAFSKFAKISKAKGKLTYTKTSGNKRITVNKKTGKITVKKGLKKGTYKIKVKVKAAGNNSYKASTKTVTVKIKVK